MNLFTKPTLVAVAGLLGLAIYQASQGQYDAAMTSLAAAVGLMFERARPD